MRVSKLKSSVLFVSALVLINVFSVLVQATGVEKSYVLKEGENPNYVVLYQNRGENDPRHLIPRSWYSNGMVHAKTYKDMDIEGDLDVVYMGWGEFSDTKGKWMDDAVMYLSTRGIVQGVTNPVLNGETMTALYSPEIYITRAEFITMIMRTMDYGIAFKLANPFSDQLDFPIWAASYINQALGMGIVRGDQNNNFCPNSYITREDMFTIVFNAMVKSDMILPSEGGMVLREFSDCDNIKEYAYIPTLTLVQNGIITGSNNALNPQSYTTRAQAAKIVHNLLLFDAKSN